MNLDHLKTFHYVARLRSFTKAAHELFLTQPAVSLQIQGLEHSLKATLFDRRKKKIELTEEGRILFGYTQRLFGLFDDIESAFQDLSQLQQKPKRKPETFRFRAEMFITAEPGCIP